jgi:hypothetical protein
MNAAEKHIRHFNLMNGNEVRKETLQKFLNKLPADPALNVLKAKLKKAIRSVNACVDKKAEIRFKSLQYPVADIKPVSPPPKVTKPKAIVKLKPSLDGAGFTIRKGSKSTKLYRDDKFLGEYPGKLSLEACVKKYERKAKAKPASKPVPKLNGFTTADQAPASQPREQLPGEIGTFLQKIQRYKLVIGVIGEPHSSKSQLAMQVANAFASVGDEVAWIDWEQGGLSSDDTVQSINRNVDPENRKKIHVNGELRKDLQAVKELARTFPVIAFDSATSLKMPNNQWLEELREEFPKTVWIPILQQNSQGKARGGPSAEFDLPVVIYTFRLDKYDHSKNYAQLYKNRGNKTGLEYNIAAKQIIKPNAAT